MARLKTSWHLVLLFAYRALLQSSINPQPPWGREELPHFIEAEIKTRVFDGPVWMLSLPKFCAGAMLLQPEPLVQAQGRGRRGVLAARSAAHRLGKESVTSLIAVSVPVFV